jgi:hypothetical protein
MNSCWSLEYVSISDLSDEERYMTGDVNDEDGHWYMLPLTNSHSRECFIWKADIHCLALALGRLPISPKGFLLDHRTSLFNFFHKKSIFGLVPILLKFTLDNSVSLGISDRDARKFRRLADDWQKWSHAGYNGLKFSRQRAQNHYDVDEIFRGRNWKVPSHVQEVVTVLSICNVDFQQELKDVARTAFGSSDWHLEMDVSKNIVRTKKEEVREFYEYVVDFAAVLPHHPRVAGATPTPYPQTYDIILTALRACLRCSLFQNTLDSKELIEFIKRTEEVVYVSPNDRPPQLPQIENDRRDSQARNNSDDSNSVSMQSRTPPREGRPTLRVAERNDRGARINPGRSSFSTSPELSEAVPPGAILTSWQPGAPPPLIRSHSANNASRYGQRGYTAIPRANVSSAALKKYGIEYHSNKKASRKYFKYSRRFGVLESNRLTLGLD